MCVSKEKVANGFGRCFHRKMERFHLEDLKPGDHIAEERCGTFWHHMIVESVDKAASKPINVIHYYDGKTISFGKGSTVCRTSFKYTQDKFYRVVYKENECLQPCKILKKARERIGEEKPRFCLPSNNCEHFATECKTGKKECHQKWTPIEIGGKSVVATTGSGVRPLKYAKIDEKKKVLAFEETILSILQKISSKAKAEEIMEKYRAIFNPKNAVLIASICELALLIYDYYKASNSNLTKEQFAEVVIKRICATFCSIPGFWLAYYLGGMLSIAICGGYTLLAVCGYALPAFLVSIVAGAAGDFAAKQLGGKLADAVVIPLFELLLSEAKKDKIQ